MPDLFHPLSLRPADLSTHPASRRATRWAGNRDRRRSIGSAVFAAVFVSLIGGVSVRGAWADDSHDHGSGDPAAPTVSPDVETSGEESAANGYAIPPRESTGPITAEHQELYRVFDERQAAWAKTLTEMRRIQIRYNNAVDRSPESMVRFRELRQQSRGEFRELFAAAEKLFEARTGDYESGSFLVTSLDYRSRLGIYDGNSKAAKMMIDSGVKIPELYLLAARSAFVDGEFDEVLTYYRTFVEENGPEKLDDVDKKLAAYLEILPDRWEEELRAREADAAADDLPRVLLETTAGPVVLELFENSAPNTVANFIRLVEDGFYDGLDFHQVIDNMLAMTGDPAGNGSGTSGRFIRDEHDRPGSRRIFRGSLVMAKVPANESGDFAPDSASSQFLIAMMPMVPKDDAQTVFGRVIEGMDIVSSFRRVDPSKKKEGQIALPPDRIESATVIRKRDHEYTVEYTR
jgi:peptidylprolyl isomerase